MDESLGVYEGKTNVIDLDMYEFVCRYLLYFLPHRFVKLRYYGMLGYMDRIEKLLDVKEDACREKEISKTWKELHRYMTGYEVGMCPYCKKGKLVLFFLFYTADRCLNVIGNMLRYL